jgi:arylsulfatase A-like enzyme/tetratricopeptide (TPR) repeat protein
MKPRGRATLALVLALGTACSSANRGPGLRSGMCRGCNVLLITIDTLRTDRVGAFGRRTGAASLTPNLDRMAAEGLRLTHTYSAVPLTLPSHTSIMTAVSPPVHGVRANGLFRLGPRLPTLATVLKAVGYRTGAFVGAFVLDARFGLNRGFDVYDDRYGEKIPGDPAEGAERRAEDVIRPAKAWILQGLERRVSASGDSPWFAWVHLYDPHEPYRAPEPYASQHEPYDAEVAYTDAQIGTLLADLKAAGQLDRTLVMIAADHGESLGEHGERTHGVFVYDVTMRVPWIVWAGNRIRAASSDAVTRLIDLAPTILDLAGVAAPPEFEGRSIGEAVGGPGPSLAYIVAMDANITRNWAPLTGIVSGGYKLIELPIPELYDLATDPGETHNLFTTRGERARTLSTLLRDASTGFATKAPGSGSEKTTLSAESRQRLQALGYVASSAESGRRVYTDADDPKSMIGASDDLNRAVRMFNAGERSDAIAAVREIIRRHPAFPTAYGDLATMLRETGDLAGAITMLEHIVKEGIADHRVMVVLAGYLAEAGHGDRAADLLEAVVASHPDDAEALNSLGVIYMRRRQHEKARAAFGRVLELDPTSAKAYENLGADKLATGDLAGAVPDLQRALELEPRLYDALYNLVLALRELGRVNEARPQLDRFVREAPPERYAQDIARFRALLAK